MSNELSGAVSRIVAISKNAFREAVRDRILYNLILFVLLIAVSTIFIGELTAGEGPRVVVNLGLSSVLLFGAFIAIFVGVSLVWKEIEKRTVYSIFSKPVGRGQFIIGKYLGLCLTLLINIIVMGAGVTLALIYVEGRALVGPLWLAVLLIYFELTILTAVAIMFSSFSTPALSALLSFFVFLIGHFSATLRELAQGMASQVSRGVFEAIYYLMPNLSHFSFITETSNGLTVPPQMLGASVLYAIVYNVILLTITVLIFSRRNFK
jgi:ABC-type transport system involved in multi-copper enzyme maturation permease subunit